MVVMLYVLACTPRFRLDVSTYYIRAPEGYIGVVIKEYLLIVDDSNTLINNSV